MHPFGRQFTRLGSIGATLLLACTGAWAQEYIISTIAGGAPPPTPATAVAASVSPDRLTVDLAGNIYFTSVHCVFKVNPSGVLTRIAGTARPGYYGDGGPATRAQLFFPWGLAISAAGDVYIADWYNARIRKVSTAGTITTIAGNDAYVHSGDGGPATGASLLSPRGLSIDGAGNLFIAEGPWVRKISASGTITSIAGTGTGGSSGDGGPAIRAAVNAGGIAVDRAGNVYIVEPTRIRKISPNGIITTIAGNGTSGYSGDGGPAVSAAFTSATGIAVDRAGNVFVADGGSFVVRKVSVTGFISTVAGTGRFGFSGDGGPATKADLSAPSDVAVDDSGNLYIADDAGGRIRKVDNSGIITGVAGDGDLSYSGDGGPATAAQLYEPEAVAVDSSANVFIADTNNNRIRKVSANGVITTIAGDGVQGFSGDGGAATAARLNGPMAVVTDSAGNVYFADTFNQRIRRISTTGIVNTVAGNGTHGYAGDGGAANKAALAYPFGVAIDAAGNLYIADSGNNRIRKVSTSGVIMTIAGNGVPGYFGDGGAATSAQLSGPFGIAVDGSGNIYFAEVGNSAIRKVSANGIITTAAGNGQNGYGGDCQAALTAQPFQVLSVAVDHTGNVFFTAGDLVRKLSNGEVVTVAGNFDVSGSYGDGGPATSARVGALGLAVDNGGRVYVADVTNRAVRLLEPTGPSVTVRVQNGASNLSGPIAPGEVVVLRGCGLGPDNLTQYRLGPGGGVDTQLAGTTVSFNGTVAPIIYTSAHQVAAIVPYTVTGGTAQVNVTYAGLLTGVTALLASAAPGLFTLNSSGTGQAAAINQDGSINGSANPAKVGDVILLYGTGEGSTAPPGLDGKLVSAPWPRPNLPVHVSIGGQQSGVMYAGGAPGEVAGIMQINAEIPKGIDPGNAVSVVLQVGESSSQPGVTIAVQ